MKKYQSELSRSIHQEAEGLYKVGLIDAKEMHEYDVGCLVPSRVPIRETSAGSGDSHRNAPIPAVAAPRV
jgi:DNA-binding transcriptional regulator YiaG